MKIYKFVILSLFFITLLEDAVYAASSHARGNIYYQKEQYKPGSKHKKEVVSRIVWDINQLFTYTEKNVLKIDFFKSYKYRSRNNPFPTCVPEIIILVLGEPKVCPITFISESGGSDIDPMVRLKGKLNKMTNKFLQLGEKVKEGYSIIIPYPTEADTTERFFFSKKKSRSYYNQDGEQDIFSKVGQTYVKDMSLFIQKHIFYLQSLAEKAYVIDYYDEEATEPFSVDEKATEKVNEAYLNQYLSKGGLQLQKERKILIPSLDEDEEKLKLIFPTFPFKEKILSEKDEEFSESLTSSSVIAEDLKENEKSADEIVPVPITTEEKIMLKSPEQSPDLDILSTSGDLTLIVENNNRTESNNRAATTIKNNQASNYTLSSLAILGGLAGFAACYLLGGKASIQYVEKGRRNPRRQ